MLGLLLLLLGCLPCAEALKGDDHSKNQISAVQRDSQADIHAVLRDMTAVMTEQRVELRHTQQELKAAVDRLKDSESLIKALQAEQSALRSAMERLTDSDRLIKASVETIGARSNTTQQEVQVLQKHNEDGRVAFSASLLASEHGYTGPSNVDTILIYERSIVNVGNRYNNNTGVFSAPVKGVYHFIFSIHGHGHARYASSVKLFKNGQLVVSAWAHQPTHGHTASNGASLLLEAEDVVYVKLRADKRIYEDGFNYNTFSGHLLFQCEEEKYICGQI